MRALGRKKRQAFYQQFLHQELRVLIEDRRKKETGKWKGLSRNYIPVFLSNETGPKAHPDLINHEWIVKVTELTEKGVVAKVLEG
jgi:tRNA A37 methylthiotransferase MiaB